MPLACHMRHQCCSMSILQAQMRCEEQLKCTGHAVAANNFRSQPCWTVQTMLLCEPPDDLHACYKSRGTCISSSLASVCLLHWRGVLYELHSS